MSSSDGESASEADAPASLEEECQCAHDDAYEACSRAVEAQMAVHAQVETGLRWLARYATLRAAGATYVYDAEEFALEDFSPEEITKRYAAISALQASFPALRPQWDILTQELDSLILLDRDTE
jgi:hypothetical protein